MSITPPRYGPNHPDRQKDCQSSLEFEFARLEADAIEAGWTPKEVALAMMDLARSTLLALSENQKTRAAVDVARLLKKLRRPPG